MQLKISLSSVDLPPSQVGKHTATAWTIVYDGSTRKFLMLKRAKNTNNPNLWNFPGGGTDGASPREGAKRELREEAGIKIKKSDLVPITNSRDGSIHYYLLMLESTPKLKIDSKESSKHKWMSMEDIVNLGDKLHSKTALFLATPVNRWLVNMEIRKSGLPANT